LGPSQHHPEEGRVPFRSSSSDSITKEISSRRDDKSIVMFFKKGLRDPSLIRKLTMKNSRTSQAMFAIANKYALAEGVTLDIRE
jgi:hypothetical protein